MYPAVSVPSMVASQCLVDCSAQRIKFCCDFLRGLRRSPRAGFPHAGVGRMTVRSLAGEGAGELVPGRLAVLRLPYVGRGRNRLQ